VGAHDAERDVHPPDPPSERPSLDRVTAVVLNWNLPDHTLRCVRALVDDGIPPERIVVVENGPTDEAWSRISSELSECILVRTGANVGFARANNLGARALPGDAYLLVNNDAFVHRPGSVTRLVGALQREAVGIVVPRLLNADLSLQSSVAPFTGPLVALVRASGVSRFFPNRWQPRLSTHWDHASSREVPAAIGPVMLVDGTLWDALRGFRESAFMYAEDIDLCWRARELGWRTWFASDAEFVHLFGASSDRRWSATERSERVARAEAEVIRRHLAPARAATAVALMRLGLAVRARYFGLVGDHAAAASCRGSLRGLRVLGVEEAVPETTVEVFPPSAGEAAGRRSASGAQELADSSPRGPG
jgi:N-acetylglucosaminyl-diphospho-decaprenol L-rhamnosyltransferase